MRHMSGTGNGMVVSPHHLASEAGLDILRQGGSAVEAIVATAATLGVVYPHMTGIGGDGFWMILPGHGKSGLPPAATEAGPSSAASRNATAPPDSSAPATPFVIDASGRSAALASPEWFAANGCEAALPKRGPCAALTMAGAVSGWHTALATAAAWPRQGLSPAPLPLERLLAKACAFAENGYPVSASQSAMTESFLHELAPQPGFVTQFLIQGRPPAPGDAPRPPVTGESLRLPHLAATLRTLAAEGLDSFYRGPLAQSMAADLEAAGSPLRLSDFTRHQASIRPALSLRLNAATVYNTPPPTQGLASLLILALAERFAAEGNLNPHDATDLVHIIVEATKQAFRLRDAHLADPEHMTRPAEDLLSPEILDILAAALHPKVAAPWPHGTPGGDTVWLGAADAQGTVVSYIQSIYHEFGSGLVLPRSGVTWNNRGLGFVYTNAGEGASTTSAGPDAGEGAGEGAHAHNANDHPNALAPEKQPFHTLNPALAIMDDGRVIAYGTMGGEGQPQTQAAVFLRHTQLNMPLHEAIAAPRWLLGRAWGDASTSLKIEAGFPATLTKSLRSMGHIVEETGPLNSLMGHAGAVVRHPDGSLDGAADPRSDGSAAGY